MNSEDSTQGTSSSEIRAAAGELIWEQGTVDARPLRVKEGIVAYRRGEIAVGILGPGQVVMPVPGVPASRPAASDLMAVTDTVLVPVEGGPAAVSSQELEVSALAVTEAADRLGNMSLPRRLAGLLLDVTELTGQPVVGCRQDIIALVVAARRETVATILSSWRDEDWIQTRYRRCRVLDREALVRIRDREAD